MFLNKDYILATELVKKMNIHIANISMLHKSLVHNENISDIIKLGNCSFINTKSYNLPKNIREGINNNVFIDISRMLPITYICKEFKISNKEVKKLVDSNCSEFEKIVKIEDKIMVQFSQEFVNKTKNCIIYSLSHKETMECFFNKDIDGYIELSKNSYLTWYNTEASSVMDNTQY